MNAKAYASVCIAVLAFGCEQTPEDEVIATRYFASFVEWQDAQTVLFAVHKEETIKSGSTEDIFSTAEYKRFSFENGLRIAVASQTVELFDTAALDTLNLPKNNRTFAPDSLYSLAKQFGIVHNIRGTLDIPDVEYVRIFSSSEDTVFEMVLDRQDTLDLYYRWY